MKRIILIVDNDSDARNALRQVLEPEGHHIVQAESGEQALALALEAHVDVFLLAIDAYRRSRPQRRGPWRRLRRRTRLADASPS